jgi:hypothetical protein
MFDLALFRTPSMLRLDLGSFSEALLYYRKVHLIIQDATIVPLVKSVGLPNFFRLLEAGYLSASYYDHTFAASADGPVGMRVRNYIEYQFQGERPSGKLPASERFESLFRRSGLSRSEARRTARDFMDKVPSVRPATDAGDGIVEMAKADSRDNAFVNSTAKIVISDMVPGIKIPEHWDLRLHEVDGGFVAVTNIDFNEVSAAYAKATGSEERIDVGHVMVNILEARAELAFSAKHMAELYTSSRNSNIITKKLSLLLSKRNANQAKIGNFEEVLLRGAGIRSLINNSERSFTEFVDLLDQAAKFKEWLVGLHPERGLVEEYVRELSASSWLDKIPGKTSRFLLGIGLGAAAEMMFPSGIGTAAAVAYSAADTYLLDKILKGWKPNQFVNGELLAFVGNSN